jgi:hypothetical protein
MDILIYSFDDPTDIYKLLYFSSRQMRQLLIKNFIVLKKILDEIPSIEAIILLTHDYKTSKAAR